MRRSVDFRLRSGDGSADASVGGAPTRKMDGTSSRRGLAEPTGFRGVSNGSESYGLLEYCFM